MSKKISETTNVTSLTGEELLPLVQDGDNVHTKLKDLHPWVNVAQYGSLVAAVSAIGTTTKVALVYETDLPITAPLSIESNIELLPFNGAKIIHGSHSIFYGGSTSKWTDEQKFDGTGYITGLKGTVKVGWFGAKGEGTNDAPAIIQALKAGAGQTVEFTSGKTYTVSGDLLRIYDNTTIMGYGATLKLEAGGYTTTRYFLGNDTTISWDENTDPSSFTKNIAIYGITIDGNISEVTTTNGTTGVHIYKVDGFKMVDMIIKDLPGDIGVGYGFITSMSNDVYVSRCYFGRTPRSNIYLWESRNCNISECKFDGSHYRDCMSVGGMDPTTYQTTTFNINNCWMRNTLATSTHGIRFSGNVVGFIDNVRISGYLANDGGGSGATAIATVIGDAVTAVTPVTLGEGYVTAPNVRIYGAGGRIAQIHAVLGTGDESDKVVNYIVDDGGSGYTDTTVIIPPASVPPDPPTVYVGKGTEGLYFVGYPTQNVIISNVRVDNAEYGVLIESDSTYKKLEFHNLQVGLNSTVRNGFRSLSANAYIKIQGGIFKNTERTLYIAYAEHSSVMGAHFDGGNSAVVLNPSLTGTSIFDGNTITNNSYDSYSMLVGGDVNATAIITNNVLKGNYSDVIYCIGKSYILNNIASSISGSHATIVTNAYRTVYQSAIPTTGTWKINDRVVRTPALVGQIRAWTCTAAGTAGTLNSGNTTGNTTAGSNVIVVDSTSGIVVGNFITVAGIGGTTSKKVVSISGTNVTVDTTATNTVIGGVVSYVAPVFTSEGTLV